MNLEQLQAKSDTELNRLAAVHILWGGIVNVPSEDWLPTTDMNCAMRLWDKLHSQGWELSLSCDHKMTTPWDCRMFLIENRDVVKKVITHEKTAPRAITIASILAKE